MRRILRLKVTLDYAHHWRAAAAAMIAIILGMIGEPIVEAAYGHNIPSIALGAASVAAVGFSYVAVM